ncbi:MAG: D-2-hydroxyacid dehydrogenase [Christensenellales bacterium]|jgi:phosphoglycerate dehydrogenase-like enzyme
MSKQVLVTFKNLTEEMRDEITQAIQKHGYQATFYDDSKTLKDAKGVEIIFGAVRSLETANALKWLCVPSAGVDSYLKNPLIQSGEVMLSNSSGAYGVTLAEHVLMVTLELLRRQMDYNRIVSRRDWVNNLPIQSIKGSRVTFFGTGDIGQECAKRIRHFEPQSMVGVNRAGGNPGNLFDWVVTVNELNQVLLETDILIMSLPGTKETTHIIGQKQLQLMPKQAILVNVGRGNTVNQRALQSVMEQGHLAGAALDVFELEPLPKDDPIWSCPRLLITPHCAGNQTLPYTVKRIVQLFLEDFERYCKGERLYRLVNKQLGY